MTIIFYELPYAPKSHLKVIYNISNITNNSVNFYYEEYKFIFIIIIYK